MLRSLILMLFALYLPLSIAAAEKASIAFYNVENMFDHIDDPEVDDSEYTPNGRNAWTEKKALQKINNIATVISQIAPDVIGLSEVENENVLQILVNTPALKAFNYRYVHFDSPDARGIDVALLFKADRLVVEEAKTIPVKLPGFKLTRDILMVKATLADESFVFFVNHWPSRSGSEAATIPYRREAARTLRQSFEQALQVYPASKVVIMGDFNDNPSDRSLRTDLNAKAVTRGLTAEDLFNPFYSLFKKGYGSNVFQDVWHSFDQIIISEQLVNPSIGFKYSVAKVYRAKFLIETSGQYRGYPKRSYSNGNIGYSDHLPVYIELVK